MKEELIQFETAKLAKEKGFQENAECFYQSDGNVRGVTYYDMTPNNKNITEHWFACTDNGATPECTACSQSVLQRWLREVHGIDVWAFPIKDLTFKSGKSYTYLILDAEPPKLKMLYATYELALESALLEGLKLIEL